MERDLLAEGTCSGWSCPEPGPSEGTEGLRWQPEQSAGGAGASCLAAVAVPAALPTASKSSSLCLPDRWPFGDEIYLDRQQGSQPAVGSSAGETH